MLAIQSAQGLANRAAYARQWDQRQAAIVSAARSGAGDVTVTALDSLAGLQEMNADPNQWVNRCAATYYGVNNIVAGE
jgi:hypothetical protein